MTGFQSKRQASKVLLEQARDALDDALICTHLGTVDSFPTAQAALAALIDWHVQVALDPEVSSDAQALVDRGAAVAEPLTHEQVYDLLRRIDPMTVRLPPGYRAFARAIEQAHGIKGSAA